MPAAAQQASITQTIAGTRLDVTATGEVTRVPDVAIITAGVVSRSATATGALQDAANRMAKVLAALKRAGVADRDIQTSNVSLNPEYRYPENQSPQLTGYTATNQLTVRFRDIGSFGQDPRCAGQPGRQPDQRPEPDHRQARGCAGRGARQRRRDRPCAGRSSMRERWGCAWCAWFR